MVINPKRCLDLGYIYNVADPKKQLSINGIDLRLKEVRTLRPTGSITRDKTFPSPTILVSPIDGFYYFEKGTIYDVVFFEGIKVPENAVAKIQQRSSLARIGGFVISGLYDSGYVCENLGAFVIAQNNFTVEEGARIAQIFFQKSDSYGLYSGQFQNGKGWQK